MLKKLFSRSYQVLNLIEIKKSALISNYRFFQKLYPPTKIAPVLKSNAYGHGLKLVAKFVDQEINPPFICLDSLYEAYELEGVKIKTPILIMGYTFPKNLKTFRKLRFVFPVYDLETAETINKHQPQAEIHFKIDTGMNRLGIQPKQVRNFIEKIKKLKNLKAGGIYSHLANPENKQFTRKQIKTFKEVINIFKQEGFFFQWRHISATGGSLEIKDPEFNLARIGLGFYGLSPFKKKTKLDKALKPALKLSSHIVQIKTIGAGERVSYGNGFKTKEKTKIGILPLGYYDGLDRKLSNKGLVFVKNKKCPIIGKICMNLTVINLNGPAQIRVGEKVIIHDDKTSSVNSIKNSAEICQTIPYTLLASLSETTRRILI